MKYLGGLLLALTVTFFAGGGDSLAQESGDLSGGGGSLGGSSGGGSVAPPAENWTISAGNVDLRTGTYVYDKTDLSLAGLELTRSASAELCKFAKELER